MSREQVLTELTRLNRFLECFFFDESDHEY
jgi:hypothetical protein